MENFVHVTPAARGLFSPKFCLCMFFACSPSLSPIVITWLKPAIQSRDTGQQISCFDSCQLIITWMSNTNDIPMVMVLLFYFSRYGTWRADVRADSHVTTKIFVIDGLPNFLRYGVPLARLGHAGGPPS